MAKMYAIVRSIDDYDNSQTEIIGLVDNITAAEESVAAHKESLRSPIFEDSVLRVHHVSATISIQELEVGIVDAPPAIGYIVHQAPTTTKAQAVYFDPETGNPIDYFSSGGYNPPPMEVVLAAIAEPGSVHSYRGYDKSTRNNNAQVFFSLSLAEARKAAGGDGYKQQRIDAQRAAMRSLDGILSGFLSDTTHVPHTDNN